MFKKLSFQAKLMFGAVAIVMATIISMTAINLSKVQTSLNMLGETSMTSIAEGVHFSHGNAK